MTHVYRIKLLTIAAVAAASLTSCDTMMEPSMSMGVNVGTGGIIPFTNVGAILSPPPAAPPVVAGPSYWGVNFAPPHRPGGEPGWNTPRPPAQQVVPPAPIRPSGEPGPVILPSHTPVDNPSAPSGTGGRVPVAESTPTIGPTLGQAPGMIINGQNRPMPPGGGGRY